MPFGIQKDVAELILANFDFGPLPRADIWGHFPKKGKIKDFLNILSTKMGKSLSSLKSFVSILFSCTRVLCGTIIDRT